MGVRAVWLISAVFLLVLAVALASAQPHPDVAYFVYVSQRWLHGMQLYVDLIEVNPPLIIVLTTFPVWLAEQLDLPATAVFMAAVGLVIVLSSWLTARLLAAYSPLFSDRLRTACAIVIVFAVVPRLAFGQREHLLTALVLPYLALVALRLRGQPIRAWLAIAIGIAAAVGFALKPHQILALVLIEAFALARGLRPFRPETWAVAAGLVVYVVGIFALFPSYFTETLPLVLTYYRVDDIPWSTLFGSRYFIGMCIIALAVAALSRVRQPNDPLPIVLSAFALGAAIAYLAQRKGWFYQTLPFFLVAGLCLAYRLADIAERWAQLPTRRPSWRLVLGTIALMVIVQGLFIGKQIVTVVEAPRTPAYQLAERIRQGHFQKVLILSEETDVIWPVVIATDVEWASRFISGWALRSESILDQQTGQRSQRILDMMAEDFVTMRPDVVVFSTADSLDYLGMLLESPTFAARWQSYAEVAPLGNLLIFEMTDRGARPAGNQTVNAGMFLRK
jgi:hypothetical protein